MSHPAAPPGAAQPVPSAPRKSRLPLILGGSCGCLVIAAVGLVVLALILGVMGFIRLPFGPGGHGEVVQPPPSASSSAPATTDPVTTDPVTIDSAPTTTDPAPTTPAVSPEDDAAARQRYLEYFQALAAGDPNAVCTFYADPIAGAPITIDAGWTQDCVNGTQDSLDTTDMDQLRSNVDAMTVDSFLTAPRDDGSIDIGIADLSDPQRMIKCSDGQWYLERP